MYRQAYKHAYPHTSIHIYTVGANRRFTFHLRSMVILRCEPFCSVFTESPVFACWLSYYWLLQGADSFCHDISLVRSKQECIRACDYVKFKTGWNLLPVLKIVTHRTHTMLHMWPGVLFLVWFLPGLRASIGVIRSYSSCPFLCTLEASYRRGIKLNIYM